MANLDDYSGKYSLKQEMSDDPNYINVHVAAQDVPTYVPTVEAEDKGRPLADESKLPGKMKRQTRKNDRFAYYRQGQLQYSVDDVPPWYLCLLLGFQHYLIMFGATASNPLTLAPFMCIAANDTTAKSELIGTIFVTSGISTLLQTTLGVRLPLVQGGTFTFVTPSIAILSLPAWSCQKATSLSANVTSVQASNHTTLLGLDGTEPMWHSRIREIQGAIIVASLFQVVIGFSGIMGLLLRWIGPLSIAPTIALAGLALFGVAADYSSKQWWITLVTVILIAAFSQYTKNINIPCLRFERGKGCVRERFPIFRLFPVILAIGITWIICAILTAAGVFPKDPKAWGVGDQTTLSIDVLEKAAWFRFPYPGQWGMPTVSSAGVFGMLAGVLASMVESVGDYYACARLSKIPPPPMHALNRGIGVEGLCCVLAGAWGCGSGTTTYSENIGAIGITKVASRRVFQSAAVIMILFGVFNKFGALFVTIPDPIVGGVFIVMFGMVTAVGISNLQFVDLNSSRNLFIIGFSFFFGLTLPGYLEKNSDAINTGSLALDQIFTVLLKTSMFVGGLAGFVLDNTIPGTDAERGLLKWRQDLESPAAGGRDADDVSKANTLATYDIPFVTRYLERWPWTRYLPFSPTFDEGCFTVCCKKRTNKKDRRSNRRRSRRKDESIV